MQNKYEHHARIVSFIASRVLSSASQWLAVSLTFKQGLPRPNCTVEKIDRDQLSRTVGQILKSINRWVYGAAYRRYKKRLRVVSVIEKGSTGRLHVHMLLQVPSHLAGQSCKLTNRLKEVWQGMRWAHNQGHIELLGSQTEVEAWTKYILKEHLHTDEALDHRNLYI